MKKGNGFLGSEVLQNTLISLISIVLSLITGAIVILALGQSPVAAYSALLKGSLGSLSAISSTLTTSVPLILSGLAVAVAFRGSAFNIGVEGQLIIGSLCATLVGVYVPLPPGIHLVATLLAGILGGTLYALIAALLKSRCNVSVVIATIMLNYVAQLFAQYCVMGPFHGNTSAQATDRIMESAMLPQISPAPFKLNLGFVIMILTVVGIYIYLNKTAGGYELTAVGMNPVATEFQGVDVKKNMFVALLISGALAGLAGSIEITGTLKRMVNGFSTGYGFRGIPIALMARNNPLVIVISGLFFAVMRSGAFMMQASAGVSADMVDLIQGLVVVFLCLENLIRYYIQRRKN